MKGSDFYLTRFDVGDRTLYRIIRKKHPITGCASIVWTGMRCAAREALDHWRAMERSYTNQWREFGRHLLYDAPGSTPSPRVGSGSIQAPDAV